MKTLYNNTAIGSPKVSVVLLDWSCRESFHSLYYLADQTVPKEQYEIVWIEYFSRHSREIKASLEECKKNNSPPVVDKWMAMGMPENLYYHKHLMYNIGILGSHGEIVVLCDSDAVFPDTFVETVIKSFEEDRNIVLHIDEVRNEDRSFYPFNYPMVEDIQGRGCVNWEKGKTTGFLDETDQIHTLNYGACMCALREDLIDIGGADEHRDYLGHICGPYEMTFRLVNAGKKEVWLDDEFIYHTWHPGTDGKGNYMGPHDGRNVSLTALSVKTTGRVLPLQENPAIQVLRLKQDDIIYEPLLSQAIPEKEITGWAIEDDDALKSAKEPLAVDIQLKKVFFKILWKHFYMKVTKFSRKGPTVVLGKLFKVFTFIRNTAHYYRSISKKCDDCIKWLNEGNVTEFAVYGAGDATEVLLLKTAKSPAKIDAVYDKWGGKVFHGFKVMPVGAIRNYRGIVVIADIVGVEDKFKILKKVGIEEERIKVL